MHLGGVLSCFMTSRRFLEVLFVCFEHQVENARREVKVVCLWSALLCPVLFRQGACLLKWDVGASVFLSFAVVVVAIGFAFILHLEC